MKHPKIRDQIMRKGLPTNDVPAASATATSSGYIFWVVGCRSKGQRSGLRPAEAPVHDCRAEQGNAILIFDTVYPFWP